MGDVEALPEGGDGAGEGATLEERHPANPEPASVPAAVWQAAEGVTSKVVGRIHPTVASDRRRRAVIDYVQRLVRGCIGCEVFPYGSVPLKTYLPDGDIDITALCIASTEESLAVDLRSVLELEEQNKDSEFVVKDVQYIRAEVKILKCLVQNIVIDVSFNQIGGLSALCFLEKVDEMIGKGHLLKRSIMLIKAWCYYESRILGAPHGLISTYALEILVLYIFQLFHKILDGPLAVLYMFLDYYSKFDWEKYGVSLRGPVILSSLPDIVVDPPDSQDSCLFLGEDFLRQCARELGVTASTNETVSRAFTRKHLNIVDPLKDSNNLGRSVSKGNFYRICSAFVFGARKLGEILQQPIDVIEDEVNVFFRSTLERHSDGERPDIYGAPAVDLPCSLRSLDLNAGEGKSDTSVAVPPANGYEGDFMPPRSSYDEVSRSFDARTVDNVHSSANEMVPFQPAKHYRAPHLYFRPENGPMHGNMDNIYLARPLNRPPHFDESGHLGTTYGQSMPWSRSSSNSSYVGPFDGMDSYNSWNVFPPEQLHPMDWPIARNGSPVTDGDRDDFGNPNCLLDLAGDFEGHFDNLLCARHYQDYSISGRGSFSHPMNRPAHVHYKSRNSWNSFNRRHAYPFIGSNGESQGPPFPQGYYLVNNPIMAAYHAEGSSSPRGTGTYIPNMNLRPPKERPAAGRGKPLSHNYHPKYVPNGRTDMMADVMAPEDLYFVPTRQQYMLRVQPGSPTALERSKPIPPASAGDFCSNDPSNSQVNAVESLSSSSALVGGSSKEQTGEDSTQSEVSESNGPLLPMQRYGSSSTRRRGPQPYQLKDNDDFPPLTG